MFVPLNHEKISSLLDKEKKIVLFDTTASTNDIAWEYARGDYEESIAIFAEDQTNGRGRRANQWKSKKGESLLCSVLIKQNKLDSEIIVLATAVALADAIYKNTSILSGIKWPNDIFISKKKVAGILVEVRQNIEQIGNDVVIGFGINCNQSQKFFASVGLGEIATSLYSESGKEIDRNALAADILNSLDTWLANAACNSDTVISRWKSLSTQLGHRVTLEYNNEIYAGQCINVDPTKGLVLQLDRGGVRMFDAAHSSIVKVES